MKLSIEVTSYSGKEHINIRFPYKLVETGGPLRSVKQEVARFNGDGDLLGPYEPGHYLLASLGEVYDGPKLDTGMRARLLKKGYPEEGPCWLSLGSYLVGKELPSAKIPSSKILDAMHVLTSWARYGIIDGRWRSEQHEAESAALTLGFDGIKIVEPPSNRKS